jgi:protein-disulfide isomerase
VHAGRLGVVVGGAAYALYLVYVQVEVLEALCALCLASSALTGLLFVGQALILVRDFQLPETTMTTRLFKRDLTIYVYLAALTAVLVGADVAYFGSLAPASDERATAQQRQFSGAACQLDPQKEPVPNPSSLVNFQDVTKGPSDAPVTVVEYFDPNCPHCKTFHETMSTLVSEYQDEVQFVYKPFPLQGASLPEIQALYAANQEGKFTEMLNGQYARQSRSGITEQDLRAIASEIGMNPDVLMSRIEQDKYRKMVIQQRKRAIEIGVNSTPTVLVNGHFVGSRSLECMRMFIERAQNGKLAANTSG